MIGGACVHRAGRKHSKLATHQESFYAPPMRVLLPIALLPVSSGSRLTWRDFGDADPRDKNSVIASPHGDGDAPTELIPPSHCLAHVLAPKCLKPIVKASHFLSSEGGLSDLLTWWARKGVGLAFWINCAPPCTGFYPHNCHREYRQLYNGALSSADRHRADADAPSNGNPEHGSCGTHAYPHL